MGTDTAALAVIHVDLHLAGGAVNAALGAVDPAQIAIDAGIGCSFWTVNELEDAKMLYDMGIRYIETDIFVN